MTQQNISLTAVVLYMEIIIAILLQLHFVKVNTLVICTISIAVHNFLTNTLYHNVFLLLSLQACALYYLVFCEHIWQIGYIDSTC